MLLWHHACLLARRPLPLPDASCQALIAFLKASATAAAATDPAHQHQQLVGYEPTAHAILLENLACRGAGRETVAAALEGLVGLVGGNAEWMHSKQDGATALQSRCVYAVVFVGKGGGLGWS